MEYTAYSNGGPMPSGVSPSDPHPMSPLQLNFSHYQIDSPKREEFDDVPHTPHPLPPIEEKKSRWGLGRKMREKREKK